MTTLSLEVMNDYLSSSITSNRKTGQLNRNKLNGLLAEIDFREYLNTLGFAERISVGGWIARSVGAGNFGVETVAMFPETIFPNQDYSPTRTLTNPSHGLHTICSTFHQIGIRSYFCTPSIHNINDTHTISWKAVQLGLPTEQNYYDFPDNINGFSNRSRRYNFLGYETDVSEIPSRAIPEEFTKEHLRVTFQNRYMQETSDIDGILWGNQFTYPIEIKEKTPAPDSALGEYFGLDLGPFVKLAYYASKRGNLHSLFIVREIDNTEDRNLVNWWFIPFEKLARYASWVPRAGGKNMVGGASAVVKIPKNQFEELNRNTINQL
ncbi:hypothetical protein GCM10007216_30600 [Thalassobacillus devorans]|uniref:Uncharacterized protein n=1 Tax=Thalassobacillus devorans TaxID=279813 RepID=A0ABQ1PIJ4_9BACI|nr:hypothetical protein [Thalassobacillus devorans]NIK30020.1 hypothetical protein [Thalassobacillus devorans]GGC97695.1 hypothetical protein GCM10007216_30600 [Thalassobacillus devorans]